MTAKKLNSPKNWVDEDEIPDLTDKAWDAVIGAAPVLRGRPRSASPKVLTSLRLDPDVLERLKADGSGWQTRANALLRESLGL